jgi:hypothetical protein
MPVRVGRRYEAVLPGEPGSTDPPHGTPRCLWRAPSSRALWIGFGGLWALSMLVTVFVGATGE